MPALCTFPGYLSLRRYCINLLRKEGLQFTLFTSLSLFASEVFFKPFPGLKNI